MVSILGKTNSAIFDSSTMLHSVLALDDAHSAPVDGPGVVLVQFL